MKGNIKVGKIIFGKGIQVDFSVLKKVLNELENTVGKGRVKKYAVCRWLWQWVER